MSGIDALILLAFVANAIYGGLRARRVASRGLEEYFLAGRGLSGWTAGVSMAATQFAADTPLLVTGLIATAGIFAVWRLWIYALAFLMLGFLLAPAWRRARVLTDAELAELRYGGAPAAWLRAIKAIYFGTIFNCTVLAMVLFAAATIAEPFLLWDRWLPGLVFEPVVGLVKAVGVPLARDGPGLGPDVWVRSARNLISLAAIVGVTFSYSATGGLRSVVRTDVAQFTVMMLALAGYAVWAVVEAGGMAALLEQIHQRYDQGGPGGIVTNELLAFTPSHARDASLVVLSVFALQWLVQINADGTGYLAQRSMACRSDADARRAAWIFAIAQVLVRSALWIPIALGLLVLFPPDPGIAGEALRADREASFVRGIEALPPGLRGLLLTGMLAALASTVDTHLNWGASYWTHDLYARFLCRGWLGREPSPRSLVRVARLSTALILVVALAVMTQLSSIQTAWQASLLLGAGCGVMLVLRWLWWRITAHGELAALVASLVLAPILLLGLPAEREALRLLCMAVAATGAGIAASLVWGPEERSRLAEFHQRARPPGFWAPFDGGAGVARLRDGAIATFGSAFTLFCALTAGGSWLVASPPPTWLPHRGAWLALVVLAGAGVVPWWWRRAFPAVADADEGDGGSA